MTPDERRAEIERWAKEENLEVGFAPVDAELRAEYFEKWIAEGKHGNMAWMANKKRVNPKWVMPECRSVVVVGMNYFQQPTPLPPPTDREGDNDRGSTPNPAAARSQQPAETRRGLKSHGYTSTPSSASLRDEGSQGASPETIPPAVGGGQGGWAETPNGKFAAYALGEDYHTVLLEKLKRLCALMESWGGAQKPYVDTGPVLEKRFAAATTLGWQGKNTLLISEEYGPWLLLGVVLTTLPLPADNPHADRCGRCTRCRDACPTHAITAPYQLDARRCIAYLTIEHKGDIPQEFHVAIGDRLFGCDDCLTACPWNKFARESQEMKFRARDYPGAEETLTMDEAGFERIFAGTPIERLGLERLKRNARIVVGNLKTKNRPRVSSDGFQLPKCD
jgi:epoxyqueuosine reductase QueG